MKTLFTKPHLLPVVLASALTLPLQGQAQSQKPMVCVQGSEYAEVESGNIKAMLLNGGDMFWDMQDKRFEVPKGSGKHTFYAGGIWFGGIDTSSELNLSVQTYRQSFIGGGYWPGPLDINGEILDQTCSNFNFISTAHAAVINSFANFASTAPTPIDSANIPAEIRNWPSKGNPFMPHIWGNFPGQLAPFIDTNGDGIYDPRQGDYPEILGDHCAFTIMNDVGGIKGPISGTIGMEMHVMMYGFDAPNNPSLANTMFARYTFENKGNKTLNNTYFGNWVDFDLGFFEDDFVGSDSTKNLYYAYNGDNDDEGVTGYGQNPPAQGVIFLNHPLTNFMYYENNFSPIVGNPTVDNHFYNYMTSRWKNGNQATYGGDGNVGTIPTKYMFSGNPVTSLGWSEMSENHSPGDRRGVGSHGPFTFAPGNTITFDVAYPWAQGSSNLNSVTALRQAADDIQSFYQNTVLSANPFIIKKRELQIYPNPANHAVEVVLPGTNTEAATFTLRDVTGRTVQQTKASVLAGQPNKLNLQQLSKGLYLLHVQQGNSSYTAKVVKQ